MQNIRTRRQIRRKPLLSPAISRLRIAGYDVVRNGNLFKVSKNNVVCIYSLKRDRFGNLFIKNFSNDGKIYVRNGNYLFNAIDQNMKQEMQRRRTFFIRQSHRQTLNRMKNVFSRFADRNEQLRENRQLNQMNKMSKRIFPSFTSVKEPIKKAKALEDANFIKKKEDKISLANDRKIYGTTVNVKEQMKRDMQNVQLQQEEMKRKIAERQMNTSNYSMSTDNVMPTALNGNNIASSQNQQTAFANSTMPVMFNEEIKPIAMNNVKPKLINKDITIDISEKLGYLLPGCNIQYGKSFGIGSKNARVCNFNITFGGITKRCCVNASKHYKTNQTIYSVSTNIGNGAYYADSIDELAEKIASSMIADIDKTKKQDSSFVLNESQKDDISTAQSRIYQNNYKHVNNNNRDLMSLNNAKGNYIS